MDINQIYKILYETYGSQNWWPADTKEEIVIGAILTQNTSWVNVEKAIANLKGEGLCTLDGVLSVDTGALAELIRPSGYFNQKAIRLQTVASFILSDAWKKCIKSCKNIDTLRNMLLSVKGIGPETADSILLYVYDKPIFVIDAYTKRVFSRLGFLPIDASYQAYQDLFMNGLKHDAAVFNEYHALILNLCKSHCKVKPVCEGCPVRKGCNI